MPTYSPWLRAPLDFITESTDPYLNIFRRIMRPVGGGGARLRPQPDLALIVLGIVEGIFVGILPVSGRVAGPGGSRRPSASSS